MPLTIARPYDSLLAQFEQEAAIATPYKDDTSLLPQKEVEGRLDKLEARSTELLSQAINRATWEYAGRARKSKEPEKVKSYGANAYGPILYSLWQDGWDLGWADALKEVELLAKGEFSDRLGLVEFAKKKKNESQRKAMAARARFPKQGDPVKMKDSALRTAIEQRTLRVSSDLDDQSRAEIQKHLAAAADPKNPISGKELENRIAESVGKSSARSGTPANAGTFKNRAKRIAATELMAGYTLAQLSAYRSVGIRYVRWQTYEPPDGLICRVCWSRNGTVHAIDDLIGAGSRALNRAQVGPNRPGDIGYDPRQFVMPSHPDCVVGETLILSPAIKASTSRKYVGEVVVIETASGKKLTATPNHPVLTEDGWVPLRLIKEGDYVFSSSDAEGAVGTVSPDNYHGPATAEEIVAAIGESSSVPAISMEVTAEQFHCDGKGSDICVINTNSLLLDDVGHAAFEKPVEHDALTIGGSGDVLLSAACLGDLFLDRLLPTLRGSMGSGELPEPCGRIHFAPLDGLGFGLSSPRDARDLKDLPDRRSVYAKPSGESKLAFSSGVEIANVIPDPVVPTPKKLLRLDPLESFSLGMRPEKPAPLEFSGDIALLQPELASSDLDRISDKINRDCVVKTSREVWDGHVYNFETQTGWYFANSILTHNCRCRFVPMRDDDPRRNEKGRDPRSRNPFPLRGVWVAAAAGALGLAALYLLLGTTQGLQVTQSASRLRDIAEAGTSARDRLRAQPKETVSVVAGGLDLNQASAKVLQRRFNLTEEQANYLRINLEVEPIADLSELVERVRNGEIPGITMADLEERILSTRPLGGTVSLGPLLDSAALAQSQGIVVEALRNVQVPPRVSRAVYDDFIQNGPFKDQADLVERLSLRGVVIGKSSPVRDILDQYVRYTPSTVNLDDVRAAIANTGVRQGVGRGGAAGPPTDSIVGTVPTDWVSPPNPPAPETPGVRRDPWKVMEGTEAWPFLPNTSTIKDRKVTQKEVSSKLDNLLAASFPVGYQPSKPVAKAVLDVKKAIGGDLTATKAAADYNSQLIESAVKKLNKSGFNVEYRVSDNDIRLVPIDGTKQPGPKDLKELDTVVRRSRKRLELQDQIYDQVLEATRLENELRILIINEGGSLDPNAPFSFTDDLIEFSLPFRSFVEMQSKYRIRWKMRREESASTIRPTRGMRRWKKR